MSVSHGRRGKDGHNMGCPKCANPSSTVIDSRAAVGFVRRRRRCYACDHRFTTREMIVPEGAGMFRGSGPGCWVLVSPDGEAKRLVVASIGPTFLTHLFEQGGEVGPLEIDLPESTEP